MRDLHIYDYLDEIKIIFYWNKIIQNDILLNHQMNINYHYINNYYVLSIHILNNLRDKEQSSIELMYKNYNV